MLADKQDACAQNNALWCDAVLKAAGAKTQFFSGFWKADGKTLPLYPNMVTLSAKPGADVYAALEALAPDSAVKDSYNSLDLQPLGFQKLFTGTWLYRSEQARRKPPVSSDWLKITHVEGFRKWLAAWNSKEALHAVFSPQLLEKTAIDFAAVQANGSFRAGAVFNTGPKLNGKDVLGLTNVFCRRSWLYSALHDLLEPFPHRPICTYEDNDAVLPVYRQLGFEECGKLSVWLKK